MGEVKSSSASSRTLKFDDGSIQFRLRLIASILSSRPLLLRNIRCDDVDSPGLREHEASFLRLIDRMTNGTKIEINATGTQLRFRPGVLLGGDIEHDCPVGGEGGDGVVAGGRGVGWYLEGIFPLAAFGKEPLRLTLRGITDGTSDVDPSPDYLQSSFVPLLIRLGIGNDADEHPPPSLRVTRRGSSPLGGGVVHFHCPIVREMRPLELVNFGMVKRVRGTAISCRVPPSSAARVAHSAKGVMHRLLPDVWIHTDAHSNNNNGSNKKRGRTERGTDVVGGGGGGGGCGPSPGLGAILTATTTEGVCLSAECSMDRIDRGRDGSIERRRMELPEELGRRAAVSLLGEIRAGGCVDTHCQSFALLMMCLTPEDVSRLRLGPLSHYAIASLRLYREAFGVEFKLRVEEEGGNGGDDDDDDDDGGRRNRSEKTVVCSCLGIGYRNMARAST
jgi:RNA 3'-terminal phosphate cyclase-like protein